MNKRYLGDAVYADYDGYHIILFVEGGTFDNHIFLDPSVMKNLKEYEEDMLKLTKEEREKIFII